jgi:hypothetical protein
MAVEAGRNVDECEPMRLKPLDILKAGLIIAAGSATLLLIAVEVGVVIIAIKFLPILTAPGGG